MPTPVTSAGIDRRSFMGLCSMAGLSGSRLSSALWITAAPGRSGQGPQASQTAPKITRDMLIAAETVIGLEQTDTERDLMLDNLNQSLSAYAALRRIALSNSVLPAIRFDPLLPGISSLPVPRRLAKSAARRVSVTRPATDGELAFLGVTELGALLRAGKVTATELTRLSIDRFKRFDPELLAVVTLLEDRAMEQARQADAELKRGKPRGPLHGIPWGAKDLLAVANYPTTWGSPIYRTQVLPETATVVERLDAAGAVLVAKLSLGEFAQGDVWYGGTTKNPWKIEQGSSGSSAGPASATAAGCVAFAIGSETQGSIVSPSTRCGTTGLRPTFGRVSRQGAMALSWTMDKLGPICRSATDCGLVFSVIHGPDGKDPTVHDRPFAWAPAQGLAGLRIGYLTAAFEADHATKAFDAKALDVLGGMGVNLVPLELPADLPTAGLRIILTAEAAAAFDEVTRSGKDDQMVQQNRSAWPNTFRSARFIPAVEYIQANRIRTLLMQRFDAFMQPVDLFVAPSFAANLIQITNLTGHPALVLPNGFTAEGTPVSLSFIGRLFGEADLLAAGEAYQAATDFNKRRPEKFVS
ncbi:MAG TPA: amidase [Gemmatimonadales bacterium]|nr:amidase [Gemmatimonadales bacterium]